MTISPMPKEASGLIAAGDTLSIEHSALDIADSTPCDSADTR